MGAPMAPVARGPTAEQNSFFSWRQCDISQASAWSNMLNIYIIYIIYIYMCVYHVLKYLGSQHMCIIYIYSAYTHTYSHPTEKQSIDIPLQY